MLYFFPLAKPYQPQDKLESYWPISLLLVLGKIVENMVQQRLKWFVEVNKMLQKSHSGFWKDRSQVNDVIILEGACRKAKSEGKPLIAILVDFRLLLIM